MGRSDLVEDYSLRSREGRREQENKIESAISRWASAVTNKEGMHMLQEAGVPAGAVLQATELLDDEGLVERKFWVKIDRHVVGRKSHPLTPWKVNGERAPIRWAAPLLGQHNKKVFCELLGMSEEELLKLTSDKIIGVVPESTV
ncbi:uncharacterized protein METZ01_LOCUS425746 [marine metagenome]|uniref:Uncharacterized protein n=1 Tax=marine metagenome TaxID=408172 RepID=A0A382XP39_9ZZZZ